MNIIVLIDDDTTNLDLASIYAEHFAGEAFLYKEPDEFFKSEHAVNDTFLMLVDNNLKTSRGRVCGIKLSSEIKIKFPRATVFLYTADEASELQSDLYPGVGHLLKGDLNALSSVIQEHFTAK
jgi:hypothetical protein